jgi:hypothetical protein
MPPPPQGNLKHAGQATAPFPDFVTDLRATSLHIQFEQYCQQQRFQTLSFISPELVQPGLLDLRNIQVRRRGRNQCAPRARAPRAARAPARAPPIAPIA